MFVFGQSIVHKRTMPKSSLWVHEFIVGLVLLLIVEL